MLGLFQEEAALNQQDALLIARRLLLSSLNKGHIPSWESYSRELPVLDSSQDFELIRLNYQNLVEWPFLERILGRVATEYFFHSTESSQLISPAGKKEAFTVPLHPDDWQTWLEIMAIHFKQNWNVQQPFVSFYGELFGKNFRLSLIHGSTAPGGVSKMVLRALAPTPYSLSTFGSQELLLDLVISRKNILIAGSTGSGKTSLLTSLLDHVQPDEHLVIMEDTYEIMSAHKYQTRLLAAEAINKSLKAYLSYALRLSPDRIILGEMRSHEVVPFLMAMNTGHQGLMATIHASGAQDALHRVALLFSLYGGDAGLNFEKVMELMCRNLEYVVFMEKKKVKQIIKVLGSEKGIPFFETLLGSKEVEFDF